MQTSDTGISILFSFLSIPDFSLSRWNTKNFTFQFWTDVNLTFRQAVQCILSLTKIARFWPAKFVFIPACDWIQLPYLVCQHALEFSTRLDSLGCRFFELLEKTLTWNKLFKRQKKKMIKPIWITKAYFSVEMFFCSLRLTVKCNGVVLVWFLQKIQGRDWRLPKTIEYELACRLKTLPIPTGCKLQF